MGWHWGILASSGGAAGAFDLLQTTVLSSSASSVTFSSLGSYSDYKHLQLRVLAKHNSANIKLTFNSDTGANYAWHRLFGDGSSVTSGAGTSQNYILGNAWSSDTANIFGASVTNILDFSNTSKNTTIRSLSGQNTASPIISLGSGFWNNTAAVTTIKIETFSDSFVAGSRFSLYGIK